MNANRFILHVVLFGVACIGAWLGWRAWPTEKPVPDETALKSAAAKGIMAGVNHVSNGLMVITNMRPAPNTNDSLWSRVALRIEDEATNCVMVGFEMGAIWAKEIAEGKLSREEAARIAQYRMTNWLATRPGKLTP